MNTDQLKAFAITRLRNLIDYADTLYQKHDYFVAFLIAFIISSVVIFYRSSTLYFQDEIPEDLFEFLEVNVSEPNESSSSEEIDPNQVIASIEAKAIDLSFMSGVDTPRLIGGLKKIYPPMARRVSLEAVVLVEVLINVDGSVVNVKVIGVKLSKTLPLLTKQQMQNAFSLASIQMLKKARFTEPYVNGKNIPVKLEIPMDFELED